MVVLIIEGCDLSGKTTAIEKLAKYLNRGIIVKNAYKPIEPVDSKIYLQYWAIAKTISTYSDLVILDRFYPSQAVYSYLRGEDEMYCHDIIEIEKYCKDHEFLLIYLDATSWELKARYDKRGDEHVNFQQIIEIKRRYETFFKECTLKKIAINTLANDWLQEVEEFINEHQ